MKINQQKWEKGNGEMIGFAISMIALCSIFLIIVSTLQLSVGLNAMPDLLLSGSNCAEASLNLVSAARDQVKYPDNMSAMVVHCNPKVEA